jgi:hypothetical protein
MDEYQRRKSCAVLLACMKSKFKPVDIRIRYIYLAIVVMGMNGLLLLLLFDSSKVVALLFHTTNPY